MKSSSVNTVLPLAFLLSATVYAGEYITTYDPAPEITYGPKPEVVTITKEYQAVSSATPATTYYESICTTATEGAETSTSTLVTYEYLPEYLWVSTVIPVPYYPGNDTVTKTEQVVTVKEESTKVTHYTTITPAPVLYYGYGNVTNATYTSHPAPYTKITSVDVIVIDYSCEYKYIGPHAIPGYGGAGLAPNKPGKGGVESQVVTATSHFNEDVSTYTETWYFYPPTTTHVTREYECETSAVASTTGYYTITLVPEVCATETVEYPTTITYAETTIACPTKGVYTATLTPEICSTTHIAPHGGYTTTVYVHTTVTATYTYTHTPCSTHHGS
jgi:hypothetical protein